MFRWCLEHNQLCISLLANFLFPLLSVRGDAIACIHWNLIINKHVACDPEIPSGDIVNNPIYLIKQLGERIGMLYVVQQICLKANLKIAASQQKHHNCASIFGYTNLFLT